MADMASTLIGETAPAAARVPHIFATPDRSHKTYKYLPIKVSRTWRCPKGVEWVYIEGVAGGGGGASTQSTVDGAGSGSGGEFFRGWRRVVPGKVYTFVVGAAGQRGPGTMTVPSGAFNQPGTDGGDSTMKGPGVYIALEGGKGGVASGAGGVVVGETEACALGGNTIAGGVGGRGGVTGSSAQAVRGGAADIVKSPIPPTGTDSGGSAGSTPLGPGGNGGALNNPGLDAPVANSGAGGGGAGADASGIGRGGGAAAAGGWALHFHK